MALTGDEMLKLTKAIFLSYDHIINDKQMISVAKVFSILNDYSPDCKAEALILPDGRLELITKVSG